jgi:hypothetical protein
VKTFLIQTLTLVLLSASFSCALLEKAPSLTGGKEENKPAKPLIPSESTISQALKDALSIGIGDSLKIAGAQNGFLQDAAIKIALPPESNSGITRIQNNENIRKLVETGLTAASGGSYRKSFSGFISDLLTAINRSAENSAAAPRTLQIFKEAITSLTIKDGMEILKGNVPGDDENAVSNSPKAATVYLKKQTYNQLKELFAGIIDQALNEPIPDLGYSTNDLWKFYVSGIDYYNNKATVRVGVLTIAASDHFGKVEMPPATLGNYITGKALDAVFMKMELMEENIRKEIRVPEATAALIEAFEYAAKHFNLFE